jgi:hypothetical protein
MDGEIIPFAPRTALSGFFNYEGNALQIHFARWVTQLKEKLAVKRASFRKTAFTEPIL